MDKNLKGALYMLGLMLFVIFVAFPVAVVLYKVSQSEVTANAGMIFLFVVASFFVGVKLFKQ